MELINLDIFSTPISIESLSFSESDLDELGAVCVRALSENAGVSISNNGGWHSQPTFFHRKEDISVRTKRLIIASAAQLTQRVAPSIQLTALSWEGTAWININSESSYNAPHDHPGYLWSAVLYVRVPTDLKGNEGQLEFLDPRNSVITGAGQITELQSYFASNIKVKPEPGMLVVFPSYLKHWVYPHRSSMDRISIAVNLKLVRKMTKKRKKGED